MLPYTEAIQKKTHSRSESEEIRKKAIEEGMVTLRQNAVKKLLEGQTTYQEALRVTWARHR